MDKNFQLSFPKPPFVPSSGCWVGYAYDSRSMPGEPPPRPSVRRCLSHTQLELTRGSCRRFRTSTKRTRLNSISVLWCGPLGATYILVRFLYPRAGEHTHDIRYTHTPNHSGREGRRSTATGVRSNARAFFDRGSDEKFAAAGTQGGTKGHRTFVCAQSCLWRAGKHPRLSCVSCIQYSVCMICFSFTCDTPLMSTIVSSLGPTISYHTMFARWKARR